MNVQKCQWYYVGGWRTGEPCPYRASEIVATYELMFVCGYHTRGFTANIRYPLDWNLSRIRQWRLDNLDALLKNRAAA